jgi:hypothetical protein
MLSLKEMEPLLERLMEFDALAKAEGRVGENAAEAGANTGPKVGSKTGSKTGSKVGPKTGAKTRPTSAAKAQGARA